ncbi:hypothetical protein ACFPK5_35555 [Streptomyces beijiangensis]|uniref:hypothetical protein n=1 Tax=Streptomyces beijiangensis TaxID=163361 RepID=UPI003387C16C
MTPVHITAGTGRRRLAAPAPEESVPHFSATPIYQSILHRWESAGRTLPGRRDQEWSRLTAFPAWTAPVSGTRDRQGGVR